MRLRATLSSGLLRVPADSDQAKPHSIRPRTNRCTTHVRSRTFQTGRKHSVAIAQLAQVQSSSDCGRQDVNLGNHSPRGTTFPPPHLAPRAPIRLLWEDDSASRSLPRATRNKPPRRTTRLPQQVAQDEKSWDRPSREAASVLYHPGTARIPQP